VSFPAEQREGLRGEGNPFLEKREWFFAEWLPYFVASPLAGNGN